MCSVHLSSKSVKGLANEHEAEEQAVHRVTHKPPLCPIANIYEMSGAFGPEIAAFL